MNAQTCACQCVNEKSYNCGNGIKFILNSIKSHHIKFSYLKGLCNLNCSNNGILDPSTCRCLCVSGSSGYNCGISTNI